MSSVGGIYLSKKKSKITKMKKKLIKPFSIQFFFSFMPLFLVISTRKKPKIHLKPRTRFLKSTLLGSLCKKMLKTTFVHAKGRCNFGLFYVQFICGGVTLSTLIMTWYQSGPCGYSAHGWKLVQIGLSCWAVCDLSSISSVCSETKFWSAFRRDRASVRSRSAAVWSDTC